MAKRSKYRGAHFAEGSAPSARQQGNGDQYSDAPARPVTSRRKKPRKLAVFFLVLLVLGLFGFGGYMFWRHRPVSISVNGQPRTVFKRTTYAQLWDSESITTQPGNLLSVTGEVLEEGKGNPYSITVNSLPVPFDQVDTTPIWGGEKIEFGDGEDICEPYTSETVDMQPQLEYKVALGTGQKGYMVQQGTVQYVAQWGKLGLQEVRHGQTTGQTAVGEIKEPAQNLIVMAQDIHPDNEEKLVAITFDDGPSIYTESYLKILAENDAKATFCVIGNQLADSGFWAAQEAAAGHQVISHSWSHLQLTALDQEQTAHELGDTAAAIKECTGSDACFLRAPYGDMDEQVWLNSHGVINASVYWTHDSLDWEKPGVEKIVQNCTNYMWPGSVILMHDGGGDRSQDLEALPQILSAWKAAGYRFVTVKELMESDSSIKMDVVNAGPMPADAAWPTEISGKEQAS